MKNWRYSRVHLACCAILLGIVAFVSIHGIRILDFTYDDWLISRSDVIDNKLSFFLKGDLLQHYLGWTFFRGSAWDFPIGLMDGVIYPDKISIMYTDSIPLLAIFFKILSPILPTPFQYFGLWGLLCYILQSVLAAFMIRRYFKDNVVCLLGAMFFVLAATVMQRLYVHSALAGQWLLLLGILIALYRNRLSAKYMLLSWGGVGFFSLMVHAYFVPMNFLVLLGIGIADFIAFRQIKRFVIAGFIYAVGAWSALMLLGAFQHGNVSAAEGIGLFGSNLNTFVSPMEWSLFLPNRSAVSFEQAWNGFAYLGFGMLVLVGVVAAQGMVKFKRIGDMANINKANMLAAIIAGILAMLIAFCPLLSIGDYVIYHFQYPKILESLLAPFRATGRFIWVPMYLIMLMTLIFIVKLNTRTNVIFILGLGVILQMADVSQAVADRHTHYSQTLTYTSAIPPEVERILQRDMKHVAFMPLRMDNDTDHLFSLAYFASKYNLSINDFYLARKPDLLIENNLAKLLDNLQTCADIEDVIFVINDDIMLLGETIQLNVYQINDIKLGLYRAKSELAQYQVKPVTSVDLVNDRYMMVRNGEIGNSQVALASKGILHGPYTILLPGSYFVEISGDSLNKARYDVCYANGQKIVPVDIIENKIDKVIYKFVTSEVLSGVEFRCINQGNEGITINHMVVSRQNVLP